MNAPRHPQEGWPSDLHLPLGENPQQQVYGKGSPLKHHKNRLPIFLHLKMQIQPNLCTSTFSSTPQETRYHEGRNKQRGNNHYKTELCQHILNGKSCPHGAGVCMFAHSESERRQKIIPDYQRMITYRSRACFDCVATGKW